MVRVMREKNFSEKNGPGATTVIGMFFSPHEKLQPGPKNSPKFGTSTDPFQSLQTDNQRDRTYRNEGACTQRAYCVA